MSRDQRPVDGQYKSLLREIFAYGHKKSTVQGVDAITLLAPSPMRFKLRLGVPLITERNLAVRPRGQPSLWRQSIAEIIAFINGAHTIEELTSFGCHWWDRWGGEAKCKRFGLDPGNLGLGFYGQAFARFPTANGGTFNQFEEVIEQIRTNPKTRTHFISPWIPYYLIGSHRRTTITPCHGWTYFEVCDGKISLVLTQRAGDAPLGIPFNTFQYAVLLLMVAQVTMLEPDELVHIIIDAHIYENQIPHMTAMLSREDRQFPVVRVNPMVDSIFEFRIEDFDIDEYDPHPAICGIPVNDV